MKLKKKMFLAGVLFFISWLIHIYASDSLRVEEDYSNKFFFSFSRLLRNFFRWLPFSFGDILYLLVVVFVVYKLYSFCRKVITTKQALARITIFANSFLKVVIFCNLLYIIFNIFWGINYDRKGIAWQLALDMKPYTEADLKQINCLLISKMNYAKRAFLAGRNTYPANDDLYKKVEDAYQQAAMIYPYLQYKSMSLKTSMWGWLGNYTGFTGYYNPFTGEAQLNTTVPKFLQPFVACHEVAHQLGYAKEMEANFVGYLAASNSRDALLQYSVYLDLYTYASRTLFIRDSVQVSVNSKEVDIAVRDDFKEWLQFNRAHRGVAEPVIRWIYGKYLQSNRQPQGLLSYDEVTAFIIAYYKKFGRI